MFKVNEVYLTVSNTPAKILWIESQEHCRKAGIAQDSRLMTVLHQPYSEHECVVFHFIDGGLYNPACSADMELTPVLYQQEFKN